MTYKSRISTATAKDNLWVLSWFDWLISWNLKTSKLSTKIKLVIWFWSLLLKEELWSICRWCFRSIEMSYRRMKRSFTKVLGWLGMQVGRKFTAARMGIVHNRILRLNKMKHPSINTTIISWKTKENISETRFIFKVVFLETIKLLIMRWIVCTFRRWVSFCWKSKRSITTKLKK